MRIRIATLDEVAALSNRVRVLLLLFLRRFLKLLRQFANFSLETGVLVLIRRGALSARPNACPPQLISWIATCWAHLIIVWAGTRHSLGCCRYWQVECHGTLAFKIARSLAFEAAVPAKVSRIQYVGAIRYVDSRLREVLGGSLPREFAGEHVICGGAELSGAKSAAQ